MGLEIFAIEDENKRTKLHRRPYPRPIALVLSCDMPRHSQGSLFDDRTPSQMFKSPPCNGYVGLSSAAIQAGWRETRKLGARAFVCPGCNGYVGVIQRQTETTIDNKTGNVTRVTRY